MCEVCKSEGNDYLFKNGPKKVLTSNNLYKVFKNAVAPIKLCHIHSIELFHMGERRFLKEHLDFARSLARRTKSQSEAADSPFGL
jgi:hypothetical protein